MDTTLRDKWADALESGEWKQCRGLMVSGDSYCCLGVLACLLSSREEVVEANDRYEILYNEGNLTYPQPAMLIDMNDGDMKSFPEIAAWIRENL